MGGHRVRPLYPFAKFSVRWALCSPSCAKTSAPWRFSLARLKHDEDLWGQLAGRGGARGGPARAPRAAAARGGGSGGRINWRDVLDQLPKQFKASNVRQVRGLKDKRPSEIFAAVTRWVEAGLVKRKTRGLYQKT